MFAGGGAGQGEKGSPSSLGEGLTASLKEETKAIADSIQGRMSDVSGLEESLTALCKKISQMTTEVLEGLEKLKVNEGASS